MAMTIFNGTDIGAGNRATLAERDSVFVSSNAFVGGTSSYAIYGDGSLLTARIEGTVVGGDYALFFDASDTDEYRYQTLTVSETGVLYGTATAVVMYAHDCYVENNGRITGSGAIYVKGDAIDGASSTIINNGTLDTKNSAIYAYGTQDLHITNTGMIKSGDPLFESSFSEGDMYLTNSGRIIGGINFASGFAQNTFVNDDLYDGRDGRVTGLVRGGNGDDTFIGGKFSEEFQGDRGADRLKGAGGADQFIFVAVEDSTVGTTGRDTIQDFSRKQHDTIDISAIDADSATMTDNAFDFIGSHKFSKDAGELRYSFQGNRTIVQADVDGDGKADFAIELSGKIKLLASDFDL